MRLSDHQEKFLRDAAMLILWADSEPGMRVRAGQFHRSDQEQERLRGTGASRVSRSKHQDRLACDLILDLRVDHRWVYQPGTPAYEALGDKWKSLDPLNVWGGDWQNAAGDDFGDGLSDGGHFERRIP